MCILGKVYFKIHISTQEKIQFAKEEGHDENIYEIWTSETEPN